MEIKEFLFEYAYHLFFVLVFLFLLIRFVRKFLIGGYLSKDYIIEKDDEIFIYLVVGLDISSITRAGLQILSTYKLKKFNLLKRKFDFEVFIPLSNDKAQILGFSEKYAFFKASNRKYFTVCLEKGNIYHYTKRVIKKNNPDLPDFSMRKIYFCENEKLFILTDNMGYSYSFNPDTLLAKKIDNSTIRKGRYEDYNHLENFPYTKIYSTYLLDEPYSFNNRNDSNYETKIESYEGTKKYTVNISKKNNKEKLNSPINYFITPSIINNARETKPYFTKEPPSILIAHTTSLKPTLNSVFVSRVGQNSEEIWHIPIREIGGWGKLFYVEKNGKIYFISVESKSEGSTYGSSYSSRMKFKVSVMDKVSGKVLEVPKKFHNRIL